MQQDKAIIRVLEDSANASLPPDFYERAMLRIYKEAARKKKINSLLMLGCMSAVSISLVALAVYLLRKYFSFNPTFRLRLPAVKFGSLSQYYFDIYIAVLVLALIGFDYLFRSYWHKRNIT